VLTINVGAVIAELVRLVDEIVARRAQRKRQVVQNVLDDVEATVAVVKGLDKLFIDVLTEFANRHVVEDDRALARLVAETRKLLYGRELFHVFDERLSAINDAAISDDKKLRNIHEPLVGVKDALTVYRANLGQEMGQATAPGRLTNVFKLAESSVNGKGVPASQVRQVATLTLQRHDFSRSEEILTL
jgi:hypothetical protein